MTKSRKAQKPAPAPAPSRKAKAGAASVSTEAKSGTKMAKLIDLLRRSNGATIEELMTATGWQQHSVRGAISGHVKKKLGLEVTSAKSSDGARRYKIAS